MALLDHLFPPRCAACDAFGAWPLCASCTRAVGVLAPPWCERCGRPWEEPLRRCVDCPPAVVDRARSAFLYDGPIACAVKAMKFLGAHALAPHLAAAMSEMAGELEGDVVTWVPLSRSRRTRRGFDQAELLARALAARMELPVDRLLIRERDASSQARRTGSERRAALRGAFRAAGRSIPKRVLLVDDVLTTGSTAAACSEVLQRGGVQRVTLLTAARSLGGPVPARCRAPSLAAPERTRVP